MDLPEPRKLSELAPSPVTDTLATFLYDVVGGPHPAPGRDGPMCPYTRAMLAKDQLWVAVLAGVDPDRDQRDLFDTYETWFATNVPRARTFEALAVVFPDLTPLQGQHLERQSNDRRSGKHRQGIISLVTHRETPETIPTAPGYVDDWELELPVPFPFFRCRNFAKRDLMFFDHDDVGFRGYHALFTGQYDPADPDWDRWADACARFGLDPR